MGYAERAAHGGVVFELVCASFLVKVVSAWRISCICIYTFTYLEPYSRIGLHDMPHIVHQLADAAADLLRANADDHALGLPILRLLRPLLVDERLLLSLAASTCHVFGFCV